MRKSLIFSIFSIFLMISSNGCTQDKKIFQSDKLVKKWESPKVLKVPESVCYDASNDQLYVSNINGKPSEKDGNGFISKLNPDGTVKELKWVTGLNGPKGMGIFNGKLFVADIDRVAQIDIVSGKIDRFYEMEGSKFLNDIAVDGKGVVYISDTDTKRVYRIMNGNSGLWLNDPALTSANGLFVDGNSLLIGCNKIVRADLNTGKITEWLPGTGNIDGLEATGDGRYLFSDWQGSVYLVGTDKKFEKILDTSPAGINAADIWYIPAKKLLLVPTFFDNRVMEYELH